MKNVYLSAKRTISNNNITTENAGYNLEISLSFRTNIRNIEELSVYVFSSELYYAGNGTAIYNGSSNVTINVESCFSWTNGTYHIYVFCNGKSRWFGSLDFTNDESPASCRLKSLDKCKLEKFFAENMARTEWWRKLRPGKFKELLIRVFMNRMMEFSENTKGKKTGHMPNMLVTGDKIGASAFASMILGGFASGDDVTQKFCFSIQEVTSGMCGWKSQDNMIMEKKVVIIEVPLLEYTHQVINMMNMLACIIRQNAYNCTFILHGTEENINIMNSKCKLMDDLFDTDTTFKLTPDRSVVPPATDDEEDDKFMKLLEEFISGETDDESYDDEDCDEEQLIDDLASGDNELYDRNACPAEFVLKEMIGLNMLKKDLEEARTMSMFKQKRKEFALCMDEENRNHMLFLGNPGTGKTTVAKLIGQIYHSMGLLSIGHTIETNRSKLIGEYIGQTEKQVVETIEKARGGVLFIDEAYNLITSEDDKKDFGKEVINALLTVLSEPDPDMIVIFAGYEDKMNQLMKVNPGLKDRFPLCFHFDDYTAEELMEIAKKSLDKMNYHLTSDAEARLTEIVNKAVKNKDSFFGNGRWIHNLIKHGIIKSMAMRIMSSPRDTVFDENLLSTIEECDIIEAEKNFLNTKSTQISLPRPIGFRA